MYRIGKFSEITGLPITTIRYYNEEGLLIPEEVDNFSNYRYYSDKNVQEAELITLLKSVDFTLDEIKENWNNFTDEVYKEKRKQLVEQLYCTKEKIKQLDYMRGASNEKVKVKKIGA